MNIHTNHLRRLTLCAPRPYRGPVLNSQRRAARVHWLWNNAFSFSICLTQDVRRTNAIHTLPWPAYLTSCTPSSIVEGRHWLPHKVTWPTPPETMMQLCLVIQEFWDDFPRARFIHLSPFMPRRCRVVHEAHGLSQSLLTLLYLTVRCTGQMLLPRGYFSVITPWLGRLMGYCWVVCVMVDVMSTTTH